MSCPRTAKFPIGQRLALGLVSTASLLLLHHPQPSRAQATTNNSTVTNSAAPSASSTTTGGTNINYQTNNAYNNEMGFGPGVFCRTPTVFMGGNWGEGKFDATQSINIRSSNNTSNYALNAGILIPFGSSVLEDCKRMVQAIARDREISSQLSMLRTCNELMREGVVVDPEIFPMLEPCVQYTVSMSRQATPQHSLRSAPAIAPRPNQPSSQPAVELRPRTTRVF
jgi:hypothetical protein